MATRKSKSTKPDAQTRSQPVSLAPLSFEKAVKALAATPPVGAKLTKPTQRKKRPRQRRDELDDRFTVGPGAFVIEHDPNVLTFAEEEADQDAERDDEPQDADPDALRRRMARRRVDPRGFSSKQMGDACETLIAGELTLAGIPALRVPDGWPGYDVIAHPPNETPQRISVKSRTKGRGKFINFHPNDFDWLAITILDGSGRLFFIPPKEATIGLSFALRQDQRGWSPGSRCIYIDAANLKRLAPFENNFRLVRRGTIERKGAESVRRRRGLPPK